MKNKFKFLGVVLAIIMCISTTACDKTIDTKFLHLSLDDTMFCFEDLAENDYDSIFEQPYLGALKALHDEYDAVFSLYTYNKTLEKVDGRYAEEFKANASWLKLGFHADEYYGVNRNVYKEMMEFDFGYEEGKTFWNDFTTNVKRVCGSLDSMDRIPRLEYYCANIDYVKGLKDAENGAQGFLVRGDGSYELMYYSQEIADTIKVKNLYNDKENGFTLIGTDLTIESLLGSKQPNKKGFNTLTEEDISLVHPLNVLTEKLADKDFANGPYIIYSHEYCYYNGSELFSTIAWLKECCEFAKTNQIPYAYAQDKLI